MSNPFTKDLQSRYAPHDLEIKWYALWESNHLFSHQESSKQDGDFSMVLPPPNVTGSLHLGHALNHTIQDVLARYHRMKQKSVLWLPGTDHAGIATQSVVERLLAKDNIYKDDLGREKFESKIWEWKNTSGTTITQQQRSLGESVDWNHARFTLDPGFHRLVQHVFIQLYQDKLLYRDKRMIHWCPVQKTALSNIEVEYKKINGTLYFVKYEIDTDNYVEVATTRPETIVGDEALAVHPEDTRYQNMVGRYVTIPLINKKIPIIADTMVDPAFGSGVVKITPAHDPNDYQCSLRHQLPITQVIDAQGRMNKNAGTYAGLSREHARKQIVEDLKIQKYLINTKTHTHGVGHSYRSGAIVEPYLSLQWFINMAPLAKPAMQAVKDKKIQFIPNRWENLYFDWLENIQDWCISRQLWWGHRIPAWYDNNNHIYVGLDEAKIRNTYLLSEDIELKQDSDVLDTWFSSALWPFGTLWDETTLMNSTGIPKPTELHNRFYPNNVLVTGFDIIFFWVARMAMMGLYVMQDIPFRHVYIHGLVRDTQRKKMSKSKGNVIDPLNKMQEYGTDAFRFFLMSILPEGKDIVYDESRLQGYRSFCNKIWNTARFIWMNQERANPLSEIYDTKLSTIDLWIIHQFNCVLQEIETSLDSYKFADYSRSIYEFTWNYFCDYYIEFAKISLQQKEQRDNTLYVLNLIFCNILKLLHPIMPFITEELYSYWPKDKKNNFIMISQWPKKISITLPLISSYDTVEKMKFLIYKLRNLRAELGLQRTEKISVVFTTIDASLETTLLTHEQHIKQLAYLSHFTIKQDYQKTQNDISVRIQTGILFLAIKNLINIEQTIKNLEKEILKLEKEYNKIDQQLMQDKYVNNAPKHLVERDRERHEFLKTKIDEMSLFENNLKQTP